MQTLKAPIEHESIVCIKVINIDVCTKWNGVTGYKGVGRYWILAANHRVGTLSNLDISIHKYWSLFVNNTATVVDTWSMYSVLKREKSN